MRRSLSCLALALIVLAPAIAAADDGTFASYQDKGWGWMFLASFGFGFLTSPGIRGDEVCPGAPERLTGCRRALYERGYRGLVELEHLLSRSSAKAERTGWKG